MDRRQFLAAATGTLVSTGVAAALRQPPGGSPTSEAGARLDALFDAFMDERFAENPELVTVLGLDRDKYAWAKSRLTDASVAHAREVKRNNAARLKRLRAFGRGSLSATDLANYDTVEFQMETRARYQPFDYGDVGQPFVVSQ